MRRDKDSGNFAQGSIPMHIIRLALPLMLAQMTAMLYSIVDRIYIGHLSETDALALTGLGLTFPAVTLIGAFTSLFALGGSPLASIARGAGKNAEAEKLLGQTFTLLLGSAIVLCILLSSLLRPMLFLFGASELTYAYASSYLRIYLLGTPFVMLGTGLNSFISSQGFGKTGMLTVSSGMVLNLLLDPLFIFALRLGLQGAAIASVLSQIFSASLVLSFLRGRRTCLKLRRDCLKLEAPATKKIVSLGFASFLMKATSGLTQITSMSTLQLFGGDLFVGLMTVFTSVRDILDVPLNGITDASMPVLGFNYGARKDKRLKQAILFSTVLGFIYTLLMWLVIFLCPVPFIQIFTSSVSFLYAGPPLLRLYLAGFVFMTFQTCGQAVFVGMGRARMAVFFTLFRKVVIVIPLTLLLPRLGLGVKGVFLAEPLSNILGGSCCYITMRLSTWRLLEKDREAV